MQHLFPLDLSRWAQWVIYAYVCQLMELPYDHMQEGSWCKLPHWLIAISGPAENRTMEVFHGGLGANQFLDFPEGA